MKKLYPQRSRLIFFAALPIFLCCACPTVFGQKALPKNPTGNELLQLAGQVIKTPIKRITTAQGDVLLQRDMKAYLHATVLSKPPEVNDDYGHDHHEAQLELYLNRYQPSVKTYEKYFNEAADEFKVPEALLKAIGQVQSNWTQVSGSMYGSWGVMGLVENQFIQQITQAAGILKVTPLQIKEDARTNIRAAAAMLVKYQQNKQPKTLEDWFGATKELTGLQVPFYKEQLARRFYDLMASGSTSVTLWGEIISIDPVKLNMGLLPQKQQAPNTGTTNNGTNTSSTLAATDYPGAISNLTTCNYSSRNGATIQYYFVHYIATGTYEGAISWFHNCSSQVSAHYVVRNSDGQVTQVVREVNKAWSQGVAFYNERGVGTEHEVLASNLAMWFSDPMLTSAGDLARDVCNRRGIPKVRKVAEPGINGHSDVKNTSCPNMTQTVWDLFMGKVNGGTAVTVARPTLYTIANPGSGSAVTATWKANTESSLVGYRLYYATNFALTTWALVANENTLGAAATQVSLASSANFIVPPAGNVNHYKIVAVVTDGGGNKVESLSSDVYSASSNVTGPKVLIVDGFDRIDGSYTSPSHAFVPVYLRALRDSKSLIISSAANEKVEDGTVALGNYDMVVWMAGDESATTETLTDSAQSKLKVYLVNGGKFLVSGAEIAWDLDNNGTVSDKSFINNYLKGSYIGNGSSTSTTATGVTGSAFDGLSIPFGITYPENSPDDIAAINGSSIILNYNTGTKAGVGYKGAFGAGTAQGGVVYVAFPLETAGLADVTSFMGKTLNYFGVGGTGSQPVATDDAAVTQKSTSVEIDVVANDQANGSIFNLASVTITNPVLHGTTSINTSTGKVTYTPASGYTGGDNFSYTISTTTGVVSNAAIVSITIAETVACLPAGPEISATHPKHEMRGVWLTSVSNLDWPSSRTATPAAQQAELKVILDSMASAGINTVFFQVRPESDALYSSSIDPWSYWLTGTQGLAPSPLYDPLSFAITEAHARGMELHAWINPYRAKSGTPTLASNHVAVLHPSWTFVANSVTQLDPGLPVVRDYLVTVIADIANRYDIDGVHFDDYFYPYSGMTDQDATTYTNNNPGGMTLADWRRNNVNQLVAMVYDKIQQVNSTKNANIRFGISPFGIWKSGVPAGITGLSAYDDIYCDALAWMSAGKVDYVSPQLYWNFGGSQDYAALSAWWSSKGALYGRHVYPGLAVYHLTDANDWPVSVIQNQIIENRKSSNPAIHGQLFFRAKNVKNNDKNIINVLKANQYQYKAFPPALTWKDGACPNSPANLAYNSGNLEWSSPAPAFDGDLPVKYVIYRFNTTAEISTNAQDGTKIVGIEEGNIFSIPASMLTAANNYFVVSSLDDNNNESVFSAAVNVQKPVAPVASNDAVSTNQGQAISIAILANDTDANGDINPSTVVLTTATANGTTSVSAAGVVTYTPNSGFSGNDGFTYTVKDSTNLVSNAATVAITVVPLPPVAVNDTASTNAGQAVAISVLTNDTGNINPATVVVGTAAANGTTSVSTAGVVTYTPNAGFSGTDNFTYTVKNSANLVSNTATVTVTVILPPPVAVNDVVSTTAGQSKAISVLANDSGSINPASVVLVRAVAHGTTTVSTAGVVTYTPATGYTGSDTFTYKVSNSAGVASNVATVSITVSPAAVTFQIDINHTNGVTKPGWTGLLGTEGSTITVSGTKFTMFGGIPGTRDRATAGEVTRDFAYNDGPSAGVGFRVENLIAGTYNVNTWSYDPLYPGLVNVEFREKGNTATTQVKATNHSLTDATPSSFQIVAVTGKDYEIVIRENSTEDRARFNGISVTPVTPPPVAAINTAGEIINGMAGANAVTIFPNPTARDFTVSKKIEQDGTLQLNISDVQGRRIFSAQQMAKKGIWQMKLDKDKLKMTRGVYTVSISINGEGASANMLVY